MAIPLAALMGGAMGGAGLAGLFPPLTRQIQHTLNRGWTNELISVPEVVEARYRDIIGDEDVRYELGSVGLNNIRTDWLMKLRLQVFGIVESIVLWRREEIDDAELAVRLHKVGVPDDDKELWTRFTETRPGVQDIIRFAVREVYSPEIAEKFGQFEGSDEVAAIAAPDLKAVGVRPEDLRKYWAAHWDLPSVGMGYEMLHRGIITEEELKLLMRALDIMPYWRDKLVEISYNPLTRVDVRRMHKIGVLSDEDLQKAYQNVGYNPENAGRMSEFTKLYNADPNDSEKTGKDKERDLTKTDIVKGFADGLFTESEAGGALMGLGYSQEEVEYYFSRVQYEQTRDNVDTFIRAYRAAYIGNTMTRNEITAALGTLNLAGKRVENLFNIWDIVKSVRTVKPTKSEILTFLRKKIIDTATATSELVGMGYDMRYVDWYLATA